MDDLCVANLVPPALEKPTPPTQKQLPWKQTARNARKLNIRNWRPQCNPLDDGRSIHPLLPLHTFNTYSRCQHYRGQI